MQAFMLYMSGGGVQIFSMGIVFMLLFSPFKNVAGLNTGECLSALLFRSRIPVCWHASLRGTGETSIQTDARPPFYCL